MLFRSNGHAPPAPLPPLSLSILGVEPLDEFIREIADWVNHMIMTRPGAAEYPGGKVEVEAKIGVLRDRATGARFALPVLVETGVYPFFVFYFFLVFFGGMLDKFCCCLVLAPELPNVRFESNMSVVRFVFVSYPSLGG